MPVTVSLSFMFNMSVRLSFEVWRSVGHFPRVTLSIFSLQPSSISPLPSSGSLTGHVMIVTWPETEEARAIYLNKSEEAERGIKVMSHR